MDDCVIHKMLRTWERIGEMTVFYHFIFRRFTVVNVRRTKCILL